jgi:hypothetical protein
MTGPAITRCLSQAPSPRWERATPLPDHTAGTPSSGASSTPEGRGETTSAAAGWGDRHAGHSPLLRAIVDQALFVDVEVAAPRPAMPLAPGTTGEAVLEDGVDPRAAPPAELAHFAVDRHLSRHEGLELAAVVVNYADRGPEPQLPGPSRDLEGVFRAGDAGADDGVDGDAEVGVPGQP